VTLWRIVEREKDWKLDSSGGFLETVLSIRIRLDRIIVSVENQGLKFK
jgi:hypothetical protein